MTEEVKKTRKPKAIRQRLIVEVVKEGLFRVVEALAEDVSIQKANTRLAQVQREPRFRMTRLELILR